jgi:hypothetical protein
VPPGPPALAPGEVQLAAGRHPAPSLEGVTALVGAGAEETRLVGTGAGPILEVPAGRSLRIQDLTLETGDGQTAIRVSGTLSAGSIRIEGGSVAMRIDGGEARLDGVAIMDATTGIEVRGGRLDATDLVFRDIGGPALFGTDGDLRARDVVAGSVDYGLLTRPDLKVAIDRFEIEGARWAGVALVGSEARISGLSIRGPSRHGALLANDLASALELSEVVLEDVGPMGLALIRAPAQVSGLRIAGVRKTARGEDGICVLVDGASVQLTEVDLSGCAGEGVATLGGSVRVAGGRIAAGGEPGIQGWREGRVQVEDVVVSGGRSPSLAAHEGAQITLTGGSVEGRMVADCQSGARIILEEAVGADRGLGPCVQRR